MRNKFLSACAIAALSVAFSNTSFGQNTFPSTGNVGLGTTTPTSILTVDGNIDYVPNSGWYREIIPRSTNHGLAIYSGNTWTDGSGILLNGINNTGNNPGGIDFISNPSANATDAAFTFWLTDNQGAWIQRLMSMDKSGQVVIGHQVWGVSSSDYKLYVETGILTEKLKVATIHGGNWSDYVFAKDYKLRTLSDVENFINKNSHLPDVPSAEDVVNNGYDVSQMDATLLRKIEELTLYVIEQQKQIDALKSKLNK